MHQQEARKENLQEPHLQDFQKHKTFTISFIWKEYILKS